MRWVVACALLVGCGRIDFDPLARCGDGICEGAAGEVCTACAADCATLAAVCGNGWCDAQEDGARCPTDCGPMPWQWTAEEANLLAMINTARTGGTTCPGGSFTTAPALTLDGALEASARGWAWPRAAGQWAQGSGVTCNGRTTQELFTGPQPRYELTLTGTGTVQGSFDQWIADSTSCSWLMSSVTVAGVAVATDQVDAFVVLLL